MTSMSSTRSLQTAADSAPEPRRRRKKRSRLGFVLVLVGVLGVLPAVSLEIYLRAYEEPLDLWDMTGRAMGANPIKDWGQVDAYSAYRGRTGSYGIGKTINSHGFVSTPELTVAKPANTLRLVFLGGSSTAGTGNDLADGDTWPWHVAEELKAAMPEGQQLEFINAALGGYCTFETFGRLWSRLRAYEPDVIVMYHGWNEMYYFDLTDPERFVEWKTLPDGSWSLDRKRSKSKQFEPWWADHLGRHSQLFIRLRLRLAAWVGSLRGEIGGQKELKTDFGRPGLEVFRFNLKLIQHACELMGADLFVAKQATLIVPDLSDEERARCRYEYHGFDHDAHVAAYQGLYDVIDEEVPADRVIDITSLSGRPEVFADHVHPTVGGARRIAALMADALSERVTGK
jgi:lysophospholipase L1-like esterase